jgi:hypothetical protein
LGGWSVARSDRSTSYHSKRTPFKVRVWSGLHSESSSGNDYMRLCSHHFLARVKFGIEKK